MKMNTVFVELVDLIGGGILFITAWLLATYLHTSGYETHIVMAPAFFCGMFYMAMPKLKVSTDEYDFRKPEKT